ncbi:MAG TPA: serine/threonine-protein kinase, partial [Pirellulales bacterium]
MSSFVCPACGGDVAIDETPSAAGRTCLRCGRVVSILGGANGDASSPATLIAARGAADRPAESPIVLAERPVDEATRLTGTRLSHDLDGPTFLGRASSPSEADVSQMLRSFGPAPASSAMGQIGPYRIQSVLGVGGMGAVFRAEDETLQRPVALKAMLPSLAAHHSAKDRFLREARSVAALKHPHVITVYTVGETQGLPYLAMEFLEGESLDVRLKREGRLPVSEVLRIGREAALGLAAAHEKGLVHRDVKPANLFLEAPRGQVKVLDFGLARTLADDDRLTSEGMVVGTLAYMAPEQAAGETVDARSDVFSLGCVLYTMCTGDSPFRGQNSLAILSALAMHRPKSPRELNADVPPRLGDLILRMLSKKPEQRPESAARVAAELHAIEAALAPAGASSGERNLTNVPFNATRAILIAGAVMALIEAVVAGVIFWPTPHGTVRIETDDPAVEVVFDKDGATIKGAEKEPIKLRPGKHA